ncbi:MAG: hypothetical protein U9Q34_00870, partial [Elusimicrobiota bacterium]|nr:hypothetical protein [Elusimicrobiota bacterium]
MRKISIYISTLILLAVFVANIFAAPLLINYQGRLIDSTGNPLSGDYSVTFTIHGHLTNNDVIWTETKTVTMDNGIFNSALGSDTALTSSVFSSDDRYLEVKVGADTMSPRTRLLSVPYALYADNVANIGSASSAVTISTNV